MYMRCCVLRLSLGFSWIVMIVWRRSGNLAWRVWACGLAVRVTVCRYEAVYSCVSTGSDERFSTDRFTKKDCRTPTSSTVCGSVTALTFLSPKKKSSEHNVTGHLTPWSECTMLCNYFLLSWSRNIPPPPGKKQRFINVFAVYHDCHFYVCSLSWLH